MIEIKRNGSSDSVEAYQLSVNGVLVEEGHVFGFRDKNPKDVRVFASLYEFDDSAHLEAHVFS